MARKVTWGYRRLVVSVLTGQSGNSMVQYRKLGAVVPLLPKDKVSCKGPGSAGGIHVYWQVMMFSQRKVKRDLAACSRLYGHCQHLNLSLVRGWSRRLTETSQKPLELFHHVSRKVYLLETTAVMK
jgi:hypothetical protein